ncbi:MAG: hypothetical protein OXU69_13790 [Gemmatimonadota bacterium]|nr:hypothetical protein [Gemmatimonadota bacterium]MDE2985772.1 hypothetical protein [Gemmatimonadota bacterium]
MDIKKLVTATVVAGIALLVVDYVVDMVPFIGGHHPHGHHEHNDFSLYGILGALFHGLVLAVVLGWRGVGDAMDGAQAGAIYGVLLSLAHSVEGWESLEGGAGELVGAAIGSALVVGIAGAAVAMAGGGSGD